MHKRRVVINTWFIFVDFRVLAICERIKEGNQSISSVKIWINDRRSQAENVCQWLRFDAKRNGWLLEKVTDLIIIISYNRFNVINLSHLQFTVMSLATVNKNLYLKLEL